MADGEMIIKLDEATISALEEAAKAAGVAPDNYARTLLENAITANDRWSVSRARLAEYARTEESIPIDEAFDRLRKMIVAKRALRT